MSEREREKGEGSGVREKEGRSEARGGEWERGEAREGSVNGSESTWKMGDGRRYHGNHGWISGLRSMGVWVMFRAPWNRFLSLGQ